MENLPPSASFGRRAAAFLVDALIILPSGYLLLYCIYSAWLATFGVGNGPGNQSLNWVMLGAALLLLWLYSAVSESGPSGGTPGKQLLGLRVTGSSGSLGFGHASLRFAAKLLSTALLGIGFLLAAFSRSHTALHDRLTRTRVVPA